MNERLSLLGQKHPLASAHAQRAKLASVPLEREFEQCLRTAGLYPLRPTALEILQLNVGRVCNQTCKHCHVDAGPDRREVMSRATMELCLRALDRIEAKTVDITGGAPELNPDFEWLVEQLWARGRHVIDRCNLTILETPSHRHLPAFFRDHQVEVVASLPHYRSSSTDAQRGEGVFMSSIRALQALNEVGYGRVPGLRLVLVTNPVGAFLPAAQASLEKEWKRELERLYGVRFDALYCLTNMPISRYLDWLDQSGNLERYLEALLVAFNPSAAAGVMCRNTLSVGWDGALYDCDFNQMLELPVEGAPAHIRDLDPIALAARALVTGRHCLGCTAGAGSSCGGAVV